MEAHNQVVRREFAAQAASFEDPDYAFADKRLMRWILAHVPVEPQFTVLDVAAGTGHLARAIAPLARQVVALDLTPEMLATGKAAVDAAGISNLIFERGDAAALPHLDGSFDLVVSRFAVHHFAEPSLQLGEMVRVCRPGGRIAIIDLVAADAKLADRHNELERIRDPSHTTALTESRLAALLEGAGAKVEETTSHEQALDFDRWLAQARTPRAPAETVRAALLAELDGGAPTGMRPSFDDGKLEFTQRWTIFLAAKLG